MPRTFGSWLSGPSPSEAGARAGGADEYPGQRLGLPQTGPGSVATTGRRVGALFVDWFIAAGLARLLVVFGMIGENEFLYSWRGSTAGVVVWLLLGIVSVRLFTFTPGQFAFGLRVVSIDHREYVGVGRALVRGLLVFLIVPLLFVDNDGRGLQDKLTGTAVVRR
jgi:uncharacterized RDD family membrane protein YckC